MKDIIIVGTGKAGFLHYYSYKKFEKIGRIYFVDIDGKIKNENIKDSKVYSSIESTIKKEKLDVNNIIVDICTPKSVFLDIIMECKQLNIRDILVEKPFIVNKDFFEENDDLNIAMVHNYEYSKIVMKIKEYIKKYNLTKNDYLLFEQIFFSKGLSRMANITSMAFLQATLINEFSDKINIIEVHVQSWKCKVLGSRSATKEDAVTLVEKSYPQVDLNIEVQHKRKGTEIVKDHDTADAICIALFAQKAGKDWLDLHKVNYN